METNDLDSTQMLLDSTITKDFNHGLDSKILDDRDKFRHRMTEIEDLDSTHALINSTVCKESDNEFMEAQSEEVFYNNSSFDIENYSISNSFVFRKHSCNQSFRSSRSQDNPLSSSDSEEDPCTPTFDTTVEEMILFDMFGEMYDEIVENMSMDEKIVLKNKILNIADEDLEGLVLKLRSIDFDT